MNPDEDPKCSEDTVPYHVAQWDAASEYLDTMESKIPSLSATAVYLAYTQAIEAGQRVLVSGERGVYHVHPDGEQELVKELDPRLSVPVGTRVKIQ